MGLVILKFTDGECETSYLVVTPYDEKQLQQVAEETREKLIERGVEAWTYGDIVEKMEEDGVLRIVKDVEEYEIYL